MMTPRGPRKLAEPEEFAVLVKCGQFDVTAYEARPNYVMLRRWKPGKPKGQWQRKAIGELTLRDARGAVLESARAAARDAAMKWYLELTGEIATAPVEKADAPFTIGQTWAAISDKDTGKYPIKTPFRDELQRAIEYAVVVWGEGTTWASVDDDAWTRLIRRRVTELRAGGKTGIRATEITVSRLGTAAKWLHRTRRIPASVQPPVDWHDELIAYWKGLAKQQHDPEPERPRYTLEQARKLLHAAWDVDPRCGLLMAVGAELRLGQVRRAKRSDLDLTAAEFGQLTVRGAGDKKGEVVELTRGQRAAVDRALRGYLRILEARWIESNGKADYCLFPGGKLHGRANGEPVISGRDPDALAPISRSALTRRWEPIEFLAGTGEHIRGRGAYGLRRAAVDAAESENISEAGLQALGGWSTPDVPRRIYRDKANRAGRADAKKLRAHIREEAD
jgi:hypothetical protein